MVPSQISSATPLAVPVRSAFQPKQSSSTRLLVWPLAGIMFLMLMAILAGAHSNDLMGMLLAYVNVLVISASIVFFLRRRTFEAMVPFLFLLWFMISWPISTIYFGIFNSDAYYVTTSEQRRLMLEGNVRLQLVDLVFLVGYLPTIFFLLPRGSTMPKFSSQNPATRRMVYIAVGISMTAFACGLFARVTANSSTVLGYLTYGIFNYLYAIPVVIGVLYPKIPKSVRIFVITYFAVTSPVYLLYHSRFNLLVPWVMMAFGLLLFSEWPRRKKTIVLLMALIGFPMGIVIGEVTRSGSKGTEQSLETKKEVLSTWREFLSRNSVISQSLGRFFSTGGHAIILQSPEEVPYLEFDPVAYTAEFVLSAIAPARFYSDYFYSTTYHLNRYGLRVGISTSVELSLPGSLWMLGGWAPVFLGGIGIGLLHGALMHWMRAATRLTL